MKTVTVSQINVYIQDLIQDNVHLQHVSVEGEISNLKYHTSGHIYFTLKDSTSAIQGVMFAGDRRTGLTFPMKNGDKVVVSGRVGVFARDGKYQIYAKRFEQSGSGDLYLQFEKLKNELSEMGMFDDSFKRPIPAITNRVGVVTAPTGAAIRDIIQISHRRNPYVQLILYPALVQGDGAKESIVHGIETLDEMDLDVIIVGRGGGSIEDLWGFNEKEVAYAIFNAKTPIISAVGHEVDFTIADFVSDLRAPTPSAAAELAVAEIEGIDNSLRDYQERLNRQMMTRIDWAHHQADRYGDALKYHSPERVLSDRRQSLMDMEDRLREKMELRIREKRQWLEPYNRMQNLMENRIRDSRSKLAIIAGKLDGMSPLRRFQAGYGYPTDANENHIQSVEDIKPGDSISIRLMDGKIHSQVTSVETMELDWMKE